MFQSLPKTPHIGVRGSAKSLHVPPPAAAAAAAPDARPSSPSNASRIVHCIPHSSPVDSAAPKSSTDRSELRSPMQSHATIAHSSGSRRSRDGRRQRVELGQLSGNLSEGRASSPTPSTILSSKHAHSILHTCLIQGPPPPHHALSPPHTPDALGRPSQGLAESRQSGAPFRGFATPSMSSNEMQV